MPKSAAEDAAAGKKGDGDDASFFEPDEEELEEERECCMRLVLFFSPKRAWRPLLRDCVAPGYFMKRLPLDLCIIIDVSTTIVAVAQVDKIPAILRSSR